MNIIFAHFGSLGVVVAAGEGLIQLAADLCAPDAPRGGGDAPHEQALQALFEPLRSCAELRSETFTLLTPLFNLLKNF